MGADIFDERAVGWDTPERRERARLVAQIIRDEVPLTRSMRVIEIGAGTGLLGLALAPEVGAMVLSDPSRGMLDATRQNVAGLGISNVTVAPYELGGAAPEGAPFDLAISLMVLHHVADTSTALRDIRELLGPGGQIALLDLQAEDGSFHADATGVHHDGFETSRLMHEAQDAGFADVSARSTIAVEKDGRDYPLFLLTGRRT